MKLFLLIPMTILAGLILRPDPDGAEPQGKQKKQTAADTIMTNPEGAGQEITILFTKGEAHNHPLFAVWVEDTAGNYLQTLYVSKSIATSIFNYGSHNDGTWTTGVVRRPAALPYWAHKRGIKAPDGLYMPTPDNPVPDAFSGATPKNSFVLETRLDNPVNGPFYVLLELNQPWDWNTFWTNNKYPDDEDYKASSQPAVVYRALVNPGSGTGNYTMELIGHSHYSGKEGSLTEDVSTLTTALEIAGGIELWIGD